jgi:multidrug efflux system membrane fusion protein
MLLLMIVAALAGCSSGGNGNGGRSPEQRGGTVPVTVATAVRKNVPIEVRVIGSVEPYSTVQVKSMVAGELTGVFFKEGQDVKKGDLLFTIDKRPFEVALNQAESNLARDIAQAANARAQADRYQALLREGVVARQVNDQMQASADALDATVAADKAAIENAKVNLQYCSIFAPIGGRTGDLMVHAGNLVKVNDIALVTINQITPTYVNFSVPEQFLPDIKKYMAKSKLKVAAGPPAQPAAVGTLDFVDNAVDSATGTIKLKGIFANAERRLWPGQFVNVVLTLAVESGAVVVPSQAVQTGQDGQYVFVVKADRTAETRAVVLERIVEGQAVISKGLEAGDIVVTDGHLRLTPGAKVDTKTAGNPQTSGAPAAQQGAGL